MKNFVFALSFAVAFLATAIFAGAEDAVCSDDELNKITTCYKASYGESVTLTAITKPLTANNLTIDYWKSVCDDVTKLEQCIGKDLIQKCFNIPSISKLPFVMFNSAAKMVIASALNYDLTCVKLFKFSAEELQCLTALNSPATNPCGNPGTDCKAITEATTCATESAYKNCGKEVGCLMKQSVVLSMCMIDILCPGCDRISYANNKIDGICEA